MKSVDDKRQDPIHKAKRVYPASTPKKTGSQTLARSTPCLRLASNKFLLLCCSRRNADFLADHFSGNNDLYSPVLLPARRCVVARHWIRFSKPRRGNRIRIEPLRNQISPHRIRALLRQRLIERVAAHAVRVTLHRQMQSRMRQHDPRKLRQRFPRRRLQIEFAERKQHVRHIHLQPARRIRRRQYAVELIEQRRPQRLLIRLGLRRRISRRLCLLVRTQSLLLRRLCRRIRRQTRCIRLRPRLRFPRRIPLRLQPLHFGLLPRRRFLRLLRLCRRRGRRLRRLLRRQLILRRALHRNLPRIRRRLHCVSRRRDHIFPVSFARQHTVRVIRRRQRGLVPIRRQRFRPRRLGNRPRISRFVHFQRNLRRDIRDLFPRLGHVVRILSALQQLVIRRHLLRLAHRVRAQHVLQHHHVARHVHCKIWLRA